VHTRPWRREFIEVLLIFVIFTLFVRTFVVAHINVPTPSMVPAVLVGDHILVNRFVYAPHLDTPLHNVCCPTGTRSSAMSSPSRSPTGRGATLIKRVVAMEPVTSWPSRRRG
jgi:signal peptidase I